MTKVPRINIPNVGSDGFMTVKSVQVACEFWRKNYRGRYYITHVIMHDEDEREEEMQTDSGDLRLDLNWENRFTSL